MLDWIRFGVAALLAIGGLLVIITALLGVFRFRFALNRMHAAGAIDSLGLLLMIASLIVAFGFSVAALKLVLVIVFLWMTSPVSTHLLSRMEVITDDELEKHVTLEDPTAKE